MAREKNSDIKNKANRQGIDNRHGPASRQKHPAKQQHEDKQCQRLGKIQPADLFLIPPLFHQIHGADAESGGKRRVPNKAGDDMRDQPVALQGGDKRLDFVANAGFQ